MSMESWKAEFYPVSASTFAEDKSFGGQIKAIEHSIQKWTGMLPENLAKHGMRKRNTDSAGIVEENADSRAINSFWFDGENCSLCAMYNGKFCNGCPLFRSREDVACDESSEELGQPNLYSLATKRDPQIMIDGLTKALKFVNATSKTKETV